jgi:dsRNA-specific ribonuclease
VDAFHGDKLLSSAVSNALYQDSIERTVGQLTTLLSNAVSNAHLAQKLPDLLPQLGLSAAGFATQTHTAGTAVEAALWHVHRAGDCAAVDEVATWLLRSAASDESPRNPKGQLLEIGGIVEARCVRGEGTHDPMFRAIAVFGGVRCESDEQSSKKEAEQVAAMLVLQEAGLLPPNPVS